MKLRLETGRYNNEDLTNRVCMLCDDEEIENETHFLFECPAYSEERTKFFVELGEPCFDLCRLFSRPFVFGRYVRQIWEKRNLRMLD